MLDKALADFSKVLELDPFNAQAYNNRGHIYYKKDELNMAIADFDKAIELDTKYARAYANRGLAYKKLGKKSEAIADFNKCIEFSQDPQMTQGVKQLLEELEG